MQGQLDWEGVGKGERGKSTRVQDYGGPNVPGFVVCEVKVSGIAQGPQGKYY